MSISRIHFHHGMSCFAPPLYALLGVLFSFDSEPDFQIQLLHKAIKTFLSLFNHLNSLKHTSKDINIWLKLPVRLLPKIKECVLLANHLYPHRAPSFEQALGWRVLGKQYNHPQMWDSIKNYTYFLTRKCVTG